VLRILGWMINIGELLIVGNFVCVPVGLLVKRARDFSGGALLMSGQFWALTLVVWCAVEVAQRWGLPWMIAGLLTGGAGVVPVAFFGFLFTHTWPELGELIFQVTLVTGSFGLSKWMLEKG